MPARARHSAADTAAFDCALGVRLEDTGATDPHGQAIPGQRHLGELASSPQDGSRLTRVRQGVGGALSALTSPSDLEDAWHDLHDAKPAGWFAGRPSYDEGRRVWEQYAFDPSERAHGGARSREWTAVAVTELEVVRELARCLRLIREGRMPG